MLWVLVSKIYLNTIFVATPLVSESFDWTLGLDLKNFRDVKQRVVRKIGELEQHGAKWGRLIGIEDGKDDAFIRFMKQNI